MTVIFTDTLGTSEFRGWQMAPGSAGPAVGDLVDLDLLAEHYGPTPARIVERRWTRGGRALICKVEVAQ